MRNKLAFVVLVLFLIVASQPDAWSITPPPLPPPCPQQQPVTFPSGLIIFIGDVGGFNTGNCNYGQLSDIGLEIPVGTTGSEFVGYSPTIGDAS